MSFATWIVVVAVSLAVYAYAGYPALLWLLGLWRRPVRAPSDPSDWPLISVSLPAYNEGRTIADTIGALLATDYPPDRRQIVVVSDASTDQTDDIVRGFASRGVELLRLPKRSGKTGAENAARERLQARIIVNTDASVRVHPGSLKALVRALQDASVGVASSRDVSVADLNQRANSGEAGYVGYEMTLRRFETRLYGIIGASGSLYAIRSELHNELVPDALSRDFSAALIAREHGLRAVSVDDAICFVPRGKSLTGEYRRKLRTMTRGLETLFYRRHLMNPFRYGVFAWMLLSHKLVRWLVPLALVAAAGSLGWLAWSHPWLRVPFFLGVTGTLTGALSWRFPALAHRWRVAGLAAYVLIGLCAGVVAWVNAMRGELNPTWEPTQRVSRPASL